MIYNVTKTTFNEFGLRNGDMIAVINFLQWFRKEENNPDIKLHILPGIIKPLDYCHKFFKHLTEITDCFSDIPGKKVLPWDQVMLWDFRDIIGDHVVIKNTKEMQRKVVVFPIYDAEYHVHRNWTVKLIDDVLNTYSARYPNYEKILCAAQAPPANLNIYGFKVSVDFMDNIRYIEEAEVFAGGDTGVSHYASALDRGPRVLDYYYNGRGMMHTLPFYSLEGKGNIIKYWQNCYHTTHNGQLVL